MSRASLGLVLGSVSSRSPAGRGVGGLGFPAQDGTPVTTANVMRGLGNSLLLLLLIQSLPMFPGPRWLKTVFARAARSTKVVPEWDWTEIQGTQLFLGTVPRSDEQLQELKECGVRAVVSLNQCWEPQNPGGVGAACKRVGLAHLSLPTPDFSAPSHDVINRACEFMHRHASTGGVYVHCNAGRGRSAVCVLAYLMQARGLSATDAYKLVAEQRRITDLPSRMLGLPRPQWRALLHFQRRQLTSESGGLV